MYENEIKLAWKKIENMYYTMELKIPEESQEDIPMFEDLKKAIRKLISIEKSWNDINMASCYSNEEDCVYQNE